jgi:hypothetical protein
MKDVGTHGRNAERRHDEVATRVWEAVACASAVAILVAGATARLWPDNAWSWLLLGFAGEAAGFAGLGIWLEWRRRLRAIDEAEGTDIAGPPAPDS